MMAADMRESPERRRAHACSARTRVARVDRGRRHRPRRHLAPVPEQLRLRRRDPDRDDLSRRDRSLGETSRGSSDTPGPLLLPAHGRVRGRRGDGGAGLAPIRDELHAVYDRLTAERAEHGGRKAYNSMVAACARDLAETRSAAAAPRVPAESRPQLILEGLSAVRCARPGRALARRAEVDAGFDSWSFEKLRDRNVKWMNRKHRVPLHEGLLTLEG